MENKQMADYTLTIKADSGYESETEGRCTAEQYGQAIAALHGETPQRKPLTDEQILEILCIRLMEDDDIEDWQDEINGARAIEAAHGIKE